VSVVNRIHIFGASGSGTSTLGAELAERFEYRHLDTDNFFWEGTDPPFQRMREVGARQQMLARALDAYPRWVLTGSLCGWGDIFIPQFELAIFLLVPHEHRMARQRARERQRYGEGIERGGSLHQHHQEFIAWAEAYDTADETMRSLRLHEKWLSALPCPTVRIEGLLTVQEQIEQLLSLKSFS
jgi:adenylate kinase family enzyme